MRARLILSQLALALLILAGGCAKRQRPAPAAAIPRPVGWQETGVASWYGHPYHGRATSSGEIYDMYRLSAAHRTLPFGTWLKVKNLENGRSVEVRVNDRGPFKDDRILDLSRAAAEAIGLVGPGTAKVTLEVIQPKAIPAERFAVQAGAFSDRRNAERLREAMERRYGVARLVERQSSSLEWRVLVGAFETREAAEALARRLRREQSRDSFVVRLEE